MANDILLDENFDLKIEGGDIVIGESELQEVGIILAINTGELKSDPLIGANLVQFIRGYNNKAAIERHVRKQLELDGKDYDEFKEFLKYE